MVERTLISLPSQLQLIERLQHLIYLSSSLIFVSGEAGSGKSTLTENLSNSLNAELQQIYISLSNTPSVDKLRQQIVSQLYDHPLFNSEDNLLDTILRLQASESKESNKLLIIDGADNLPEGFIIELCELFSGEDFVRDSTLNILLLSDEKTNQQHLDYIEDNLIARMQATLNHVEFKLPPLSAEESLSLLQHNFKQADYQPEVQHQEALTRQLKECAGNPKKIIQLADDLSQGSVLPPRKYWLKTALPAILLMLLLVGIVSALGTYLYPKFITQKKVEPKIAPEVVEQKTQKDVRLEHLLIQEKRMQEALAGEWDDANAEIEDNQQEVGLPEQKGQRVVVSDEELVKLVSAVEANTKKLLGDKGEQPITSLPLSQTEDKTSQSEVENEQFLPIHSQQNDDSKTLLSSLREQAGLDIADEAPVEAVSVVVEPSAPNVVIPVVDPVAIENEVKNDVQQVQVENDVLLTEESPSQQQVLTESAAPETPLQVNKEPELPASNVLTEEAQTELTPTAILFNKSPDHYTLQLSGMATKRYVELFKQQSKFPQENLFLYETVYQNKPWFVVLYGDYDSVRSAQLAANNLPDAFKGMSSWVKQWQLVHNELRLNDE
ncbi:AAA family ATPase [Psychromonas algicola]|uniref:AAA family ATPase n=1 Tax=Psychromonas algicola TaxID=2555642 RepID=UPI001068004D|nr:AAA family ATPase [Psychromonas sp. RZ5]TEW52725.1 DUF2075 domain-containing protein [Psychromonas sp. RZ5]